MVVSEGGFINSPKTVEIAVSVDPASHPGKDGAHLNLLFCPEGGDFEVIEDNKERISVFVDAGVAR